MPELPDQITKVTYFNCNYPDPIFFYHGFHRTDLAIEIEFRSGKHLHLGWSKNDRPEYFERRFKRKEEFNHLRTFSSIDATQEWHALLQKDITSIELEFVSKDLNIPSICTIQTEDGQFAIIVVSDIGTHENILPDQMEYIEPAEFFVFINVQPPPIKKVTIEVPHYPNAFDSKATIPAIEIFNTKSIGLVLVILVVAASVIYYILNEAG
jgi:hypothetical protein